MQFCSSRTARSKNYALIAFHCSVRFNNCWSNEVAMFVSGNLNVTPIEVDLSTLLLSGLNQPKNAVFGGRRDDRSAT